MFIDLRVHSCIFRCVYIYNWGGGKWILLVCTFFVLTIFFSLLDVCCVGWASELLLLLFAVSFWSFLLWVSGFPGSLTFICKINLSCLSSDSSWQSKICLYLVLVCCLLKRDSKSFNHTFFRCSVRRWRKIVQIFKGPVSCFNNSELIFRLLTCVVTCRMKYNFSGAVTCWNALQ